MSSAAFRPPTAERVVDHLEQHPPRARPKWHRYVPMATIIAAVFISLAIPTVWTALLPWAVLAGIVAHGSRRRQQHASLTAQTLHAQELALLRHRVPALRLAWRLIPQLVHRPDEQARLTALLGNLLQSLHQTQAATAAYDHLLSRLPDQHPAALTLRLQKAAAHFETDALADGDQQLRRVRGAIKPDASDPLAAAYRATRLLQSIQTHHFAEALEDTEDAVESFRPLGIDAGLAHALRAHALLQTNHLPAARQAWSDATCLLPAGELIDRCQTLRPTAEALA